MAIEVMAKLSVDTAQAEAGFDTIAQKEKEIADKKSSIAIDTNGALVAIDALKTKVAGLSGANMKVGVTASPEALNTLKAEVAGAKETIEKPAKVTVDTAGAESSVRKFEKDSEGAFDGIKEKGKSILEGVGAGFLAGGAALGLSKSLDAAKADLAAQEDLKIALRNTGVAGDALNKSFDASEKQAHTLADAYAQPIDKMRQLETDVANFGGITGAQKDKVLQIGIAMQQFGLSARALRGIIAGAADPEAQQALLTLKTKIGGLGTAFETAKTPGEKLNAIYARMQPTLEGMKDAADGPIGSMEKMDETGKQLEIGFGSLVFGVLTPFLPIVNGIGSVINGVVIPALTSVTGFIDQNKVAIGVLAVGVGVLALSMNAAAVGTTAFSIAEKAQAVATGVVTGAQTLLNAVMSANPIVLVVAGIAALAAGAIYLYNNVKPVHDAFDLVWTVLKGLGAFIGAFVSTEVKALASAFQGVGSVIDGIVHMNFNEVKQGVSQVTDAIGTGMSGAQAGVKAMDASIQASSQSLDDQKGKAKGAGDAATSAAESAAQAQKDLRDSIDQANSSFSDQQKAAESELATGKIAFERQAEYIRTGYANGQKLSQAQIDAYKHANADLLAQAREMQAEQKKIKDAGAEFDGTAPKKAKAKSEGIDPVERAKQLAAEAAKDLETQLALAEAAKGQSLSDQDKLNVAKAYLTNLQQQLDAAGKLDAKKKETALTDAKVKVTGARDTLEVDATKAGAAATKKAQDDAAAYAKATEEKIAATRIAIMSDGAAKELAVRQAQYEKDTQFATDAAKEGRALTEQEIELKKLLDTQYQQDKAAIALKYAKKSSDDAMKLEQAGLNAFTSILQAELNAKRSFDNLAYQDKKLSLDKEQTALKASLQKGEISQREYNLKLQEMTQQRANLEKSAVQARWQTEISLAKQGYASLEKDLQTYITDEVKAGLTQVAMNQQVSASASTTADAAVAATDKTASANKASEKSNIDAANSTMVGAVAKLIANWIGVSGPVGAIIGVAAGIGLMEAFKGIESALGFATGGIGIVGENGPEIMGPTKDFSQMASQLVTSTAAAVSRSMDKQGPGTQRGGKHQFNVRITGQGRTSGRDLVTTYQNESIAQKREQLLPA